MEKALVTGICGFVGSHLACLLYEKGLEVIGVDISNKTRNKKLQKYIEDKKITVLSGDLLEFDFSKIGKVDYVYQIAGKLSAWGDIKDFDRINVDGTRRVIDYAKSVESKCIVYLSSTAVYGYYGYCDLKEEGEKKPMNNPYSLSKLHAETMVMSYCKEIGQNFVVIRPGNVYGEYDMTSSYDLYKLIYKEKMPTIDKGKYKSCFVYVGNLVEGIYLASTTEQAYNEDYNLTDGNNETLNEYMTFVAEALNVKPKFLSLSSSVAKLTGIVVESVYKILRIKRMPPITMFSVLQNCSDYNFSIEKAKNKFGYNPKVDFEEGTKRTAQWFLSMPKDIKVKR